MPRQQNKVTTPSWSAVPVEVFDCEQGTDAWHSVRAGIPTASMFATVMRDSDSATRTKYLHQLAGERLTGKPAEQFYKNSYMARGHRMEGPARDLYARERFADLKQVGFVRRGKAGCSPDSLIAADGVLEIKSLAPDLMIKMLERKTAPNEHRHQLQGNLAITGRKYIDLQYFFEGMPKSPIFTYQRDEEFIGEIWQAIDVFDLELRRLVERMRNI